MLTLMDYSLDDIKNIVTIAKPLIDPLIEAVIKPKVTRLAKWIQKKEISQQAYEDKFAEYIARTYNNCQNINVLIFQNQQIKLNDIYYPLTIHDTKEQRQFKLDDFRKEFVD